MEYFLAAAEALHNGIVQTTSIAHKRPIPALQRTHAALLKTFKDITGKGAPFIQWFGTGPVRAKLATSVLDGRLLICL
ncbi:hypothetical protein NKH06_21800 [Mesorhizobium sp. M1342]